MRERRFHKCVDGKRRGVNLPWRLPISAHRGVTLVELMISMLILAIVCISWLQIIGIQSARKEARRREAVERLAGIMDAFLYEKRNNQVSRITEGGYYMAEEGMSLSFPSDGKKNHVYPMFDSDVSPIGYRLYVSRNGNIDLSGKELFKNWDSSCRWLIGRLYDRSNCTVDEAGKPFFTLPVCLGL